MGAPRPTSLGVGHAPSAARHITVLPDRDATFTLSLTPLGEKLVAQGTSAEVLDLRSLAPLDLAPAVEHRARSFR